MQNTWCETSSSKDLVSKQDEVYRPFKSDFFLFNVVVGVRVCNFQQHLYPEHSPSTPPPPNLEANLQPPWARTCQ